MDHLSVPPSVAEIRKVSTQPRPDRSDPSCLCIVYYGAEAVYCPAARNKQYGEKPGEAPAWPPTLNSRTDTDRTETKRQKRFGSKMRSACSHQGDGYSKKLHGALKAVKSQHLPQAGTSGALAKWKLAWRFVQHEEHWCFLPNTLRKDMKTLFKISPGYVPSVSGLTSCLVYASSSWREPDTWRQYDGFPAAVESDSRECFSKTTICITILHSKPPAKLQSRGWSDSSVCSSLGSISDFN